MARASHPILGCKSVSANGATQAIEVEERGWWGGGREKRKKRKREQKKKNPHNTHATRNTRAPTSARRERQRGGGGESVRDPREYRAGQKGFLTIERHSISAQLIYAE